MRRTTKITAINSPNLNLLGKREPDIYGNRSFDEFLQKSRHDSTQTEIDYYQSNIEDELIDKLQEVGFSYDGIVFNAGVYTHTSIALPDCIHSFAAPVIEVYILNVYAREGFRHKNMIPLICLNVIAGFGLNSYKLTIEAVVGQLISV